MGTRGAELRDRITEWLFIAMEFGGECEGSGGRAIPIAAREGEGRWAGGGGLFSGIRRCGVDACVRKLLLLLRAGILSWI